MDSPLGFRFATAAALIDREGYTGPETDHLLREWARYARYAMMSGKSPSSTAEHLARFERYQRGAGPTDRDYSRRSGERSAKVPPTRVDAAIADDLRRHASIVEADDPAHARELLEVAQEVEYIRDPNVDKPAIAANAVRHRRRMPTPGDRERERLPGSTFDLPERHVRDRARDALVRRCPRGTEIASLIFPPDFTKHEVLAWTRAHGFANSRLEFPPSSGSIRAPQRPTADFESGSFRTIVLSTRDNIRAVIGCPRAGREGDKTKRQGGFPRRMPRP